MTTTCTDAQGWTIHGHMLTLAERFAATALTLLADVPHADCIELVASSDAHRKAATWLELKLGIDRASAYRKRVEPILKSAGEWLRAFHQKGESLILESDDDNGRARAIVATNQRRVEELQEGLCEASQELAEQSYILRAEALGPIAAKADLLRRHAAQLRHHRQQLLIQREPASAQATDSPATWAKLPAESRQVIEQNIRRRRTAFCAYGACAIGWILSDAMERGGLLPSRPELCQQISDLYCAHGKQALPIVGSACLAMVAGSQEPPDGEGSPDAFIDLVDTAAIPLAEILEAEAGAIDGKGEPTSTATAGEPTAGNVDRQAIPADLSGRELEAKVKARIEGQPDRPRYVELEQKRRALSKAETIELAKLDETFSLGSMSREWLPDGDRKARQALEGRIRRTKAHQKLRREVEAQPVCGGGEQ